MKQSKKLLSQLPLVVIFIITLVVGLLAGLNGSVAKAETKSEVIVNNLVVYVNFQDSPTLELPASSKQRVENVFNETNKKDSFYHSIKTLSNNKLTYETSYMDIKLNETYVPLLTTKDPGALMKKIIIAMNQNSRDIPNNEYDRIGGGGVGENAGPYFVGADGYFDSIIFVYNIAQTFGTGDKDWSTTLWPCTVTGLKSNLTLVGGNKTVKTAMGMPAHMVDFGTVTHEMLHSLGMQDLYPYEAANIFVKKTAPVGIWDIMANGSGIDVGTNGTYYNMVLNDYSRYRLGFIDNTQFLVHGKYEKQSVTFASSLSPTGAIAFKFGERSLGPGKSEFFVAEYRTVQEKINDGITSINGDNNAVAAVVNGAKDGFVFYRVNTSYEGVGNKGSIDKTFKDSYISYIRNPIVPKNYYDADFQAVFSYNGFNPPDKLPDFIYSDGSKCNVNVEMKGQKQLTFSETFKLNATINDKNGNPLSGVSVFKEGTVTQIAQSGADGKFSVDVSSGEKLIFKKTNYKFDEIIVDSNNENIIIAAKDADAFSLKGKVIFDGLGLGGVQIYENDVLVGTSDENGDFSVEIIPLSRIKFVKDGYIINEIIADSDKKFVTPTATIQKYSISGVVSCGENALADVKILKNGEIIATTDVKGQFSLTEMFFQDTISFQLEGYTINDYTIIKGMEDMEVTAEKFSFELKGVIKDNNGAPIEGVSVFVNKVTNASRSSTPNFGSGALDNITNAKGEYAIFISVGDVLSFEKRGYTFRMHEINSVVDTVYETTPVSTNEAFDFTGKILVDGVPLIGGIIKMNGMETGIISNKYGEFTIEKVIEGDVLSFEKEGYKINNYTIEKGITEAKISAELHVFSIRGKVSANNDVSLRGVWVYVNGVRTIQTGDKGVYEVKVKIGDKITYVKSGFSFDELNISSLNDEYSVSSEENAYILSFVDEDGEAIIGIPVYVNGVKIGESNEDGTITVAALEDDKITYINDDKTVAIENNSEIGESTITVLPPPIVPEITPPNSNDGNGELKNNSIYVYIGLGIAIALILVGGLMLVADKRK